MTIKKGTSTIAINGTLEWGSIEGTLSDQVDLQNALDLKANTLSPSLTGIPTAPTATEGTNTTQIATTEFVKTAIDNADTLPDQTDQAGKYLATDGVNAFWRNPAGLPILTSIYSDHILNDASFLRADTYSWQNGSIYKSAYKHLEDDLDNAVAATETIGSYTVTYYRAADGHKIVLTDMEDLLKDVYDEVGIAWYFVVDTTNKKFKLPRNKYGFVGFRETATETVGNYVEPGLPNIELKSLGSYGRSSYISQDDNNAISLSDISQSINQSGSDSGNSISLDYSQKNPIYGNSTTVQPPAIQMYLYFYVGNYLRNESEIDIAEITEALDYKLDQDFGNASVSTKATMMNWILPDYSSTSTLTSSPYTALKNGYIVIKNSGTNPSINISVNNVSVYSSSTNTSSSSVSCFIPVSKNDIVTYTLNGTNDWKYFIPMKGAN